MNGVINFFKPAGMTSHDAVSLIRRTLKMKRVGHTGTLDPNATGVLPICIGKGTRIAEYLLDIDKEYIGELTLGCRTDTLDMDGKVIEYSDKEVEEEDIMNTIVKYRGNILQYPPMYSAVKHKGKKLYELAREGVVIERKPREVTIYDLDVLNIEDNRKIIINTRCSKGTYIRTLCDDIGSDLGTYAYMSYLIRTGVGGFTINESYSIEYIKTLDIDGIKSIIVPMDKALEHFNKFVVADEFYSKIINGMMIEVESINIDKKQDLLRVYCKDEFIGIGYLIEKEQKNYLKMQKVLI